MRPFCSLPTPLKGRGCLKRPLLRMMGRLSDEVIIECDVVAAEEVVRWLSGTLRGAVADVLGYKELAGEDAVEMSVIEAWGT